MSIRLRSAARPLAHAFATAACVVALWPAASRAADLVAPHSLTVAAGLPAAQARAQILAARRYGTFWNTGDPALARAALAVDFTDRTLPPGREQGVPGPLAASGTMRDAIPDLRCDIEQMIVAGDRVVVHLHFRGHFTGAFNGTAGRGQAIDFIATDIYRIDQGRIAENWHIEDNLTLMRQLGLVG
ncbi:ester cyclase [Burkholderia cenocepacia]|uniref:ester cyclase n=1 Tax=Burkholderia cenocepacia TaxID=95486 RepID=UPI00075A6073|nr:ester cyclase [Burkholderia cenocepacia]AOK34143.1 polyketide cyclase [Burkholderia cenocepacia]KWF66749.1 polyketide cyclase [Burkholderia cenocepacia]MBR8270545.1 ester cyclase [Burkholderia cenocepacia]MCW3606120.1 ester cyclase [Burkholderia cenocepacia]MCW5187382.1 ester cyclase [Burkholderia cenocepacia]